MLNWLAEHYGDLLVGLMLIAIVASILVKQFGRKSTTACSGSCAGCGLAGSCHAHRHG